LQDVYILSAVRTPIGKFGGSMASLTAADMGVIAAKAAIERAAIDPGQVEETIFGNARQAGGGGRTVKWTSLRSTTASFVSVAVTSSVCAPGARPSITTVL